MPCTSSGAVSLRTRMTALPRLPHSAAVSASKTICPVAAPGEALSPVPAFSYFASGSMREKNSASSWRGSTRADRFLLRDQPVVHEIERDLDRRLGAAFAAARLQHVQLAALDGELEVLHVAVVRLELIGDRDELRVHVGLRVLADRRSSRACGFRRRRPRLARCADTRRRVRAAGVRIARERDARPRIVAHVAEHHRDDADRGAPVVRTSCCRRDSRPRAWNSTSRTPRRSPGPIARRRPAGTPPPRDALDDRLVLRDQSPSSRPRSAPGSLLTRSDCFVRVEQIFEVLFGDPQHDAREHRDETPVGVVGEALVAGELSQTGRPSSR